MSDESNAPSQDLPISVQEAVRKNRKIEAIKLLREERNIGLKEAKDIIDAHHSEDRNAYSPRKPKMESGLWRVVLAALVALVAYGLFRFFG